MMNLRDFRFFILAEDKHQQEFVWRWLEQRGAQRHKVTRVALPAGRGAGEQYVKKKFPAEVAEYRRRARQKVALVVVVDADTLTVPDRLDGLSKLAPRQADDRIAILIPRRNMESWFHFLAGNGVDEVTDYKPIYANAERPWASAAKALEVWLTAPQNLPDAPPSLVAARPEFARLPGV